MKSFTSIEPTWSMIFRQEWRMIDRNVTLLKVIKRKKKKAAQHIIQVFYFIFKFTIVKKELRNVKEKRHLLVRILFPKHLCHQPEDSYKPTMR